MCTGGAYRPRREMAGPPRTAGFWPRAFEDFFLERRRVIVRALGPETTSRQGVIYEQETSQASQGHGAKRGANR